MQADPGSLADRLKPGPRDDEAGSGRAALDRLMSTLDRPGAVPAPLSEDTANFLSGVFAGSSYLFGLAERRPQRLSATLDAAPEKRFAQILSLAAAEAASAATQRELMSILRQGKNEIAFLIALADLGDVWTVEEITR